MNALKTLADVDGHIADENLYGGMIFSGVREGMAPFVYQKACSWMEYDIDFHRYRIGVEVLLMSGHRIVMYSKVGAYELADNPDREMARIADEMRDGFRSREDYSLAPLIYLGEN